MRYEADFLNNMQKYFVIKKTTPNKCNIAKMNAVGLVFLVANLTRNR
jgi:hypothetical protein